MQVEIEVEQSDKGGNFIGWLFFEGKNLSISLVSEGLCKVLPHAQRSLHGKELFECEDMARAARKRIWKVREGRGGRGEREGGEGREGVRGSEGRGGGEGEERGRE